MIYEEGALILAPLSGYTDLPYRNAARRCGCRYAFTEMIDAAALVYARKRTEVMVHRGEEESWLGVQLVSGNGEHIRQAVDILNSYDFDVLDFNLGCPVPKVTKKGAGAALGRNIERALELFSIIAENSKIPVTAKIRILDIDNPDPTLELVRGLAARGAQCVTIHGRVKEAFYSGAVAFNFINMAAEAVNIPVIANGGIMGFNSYSEAKKECSVSRYMLARGAMGNPWLFNELLESDKFIPPNLEEFAEVVARHICEMLDYYGEEKGSCLARKVLLDYLRGRGFNGEWRGKAGMLTGKEQFLSYISSAHSFHSADYWKTPLFDRQLRK